MRSIEDMERSFSSNTYYHSCLSNTEEISFDKAYEIDPGKFHRILEKFNTLKTKHEAACKELENRFENPHFSMSTQASEICLELGLLTRDDQIDPEASKTIAVFNAIFVRFILSPVTEISSRGFF